MYHSKCNYCAANTCTYLYSPFTCFTCDDQYAFQWLRICLAQALYYVIVPSWLTVLPTPVTDSVIAIHGMSVKHCRWACQWPMQMPKKVTDSGYHCLNPICVTACIYIYVATGGGPCRWGHVCEKVWVDHWVDQNCALTSVHVNEILRIALVVAASWCLYWEPSLLLGTSHHHKWCANTL